jgi:protoheme IX farnesyltransferase
LFKTYYRLTKPGIIRGNAVPAIAGFFLASRGSVSYALLLQTLIGISLVIASGCVFNNYLDRNIDKKMARTKQRALAQGTVSARSALTYATVLGLIGLAVLAYYTNLLTVGIGIVGLFFYVIVYGIAKRRSVHSTLVGSISGALPPVAGYVAVSDHLNAAAITLFLILVFWQMPHFYAIAIYRLKEYRAAGLPILSVKTGAAVTKRHMLFYTVLFGIAAVLLSFTAHTGPLYFVVSVLLSLLWLLSGFKGLQTADDDRWARKMFGLSLLVLTTLCVCIGLSGFSAIVNL